MGQPLKSAPPPIHSVALVGLMIAIFVSQVPSLESIDEIATIETFTKSLFSPFQKYLPYTRIAFSILIFGTTFIDTIGEGIIVKPTFLPQSKLISRSISIRRLRTQIFFTEWSWNLLGLSFFLNGLIPLLVMNGKESFLIDNPWIMRVALISFETAAPSAMLTSFVVTYAIWPKVLKEGGPERTVNLKRVAVLLKHNANAIMVLTEVGLLGTIPIELSHIAFAPLYGITYVIFSWYMSGKWDPENGPLFFYFFLDTTLGIVSSIALVALLIVLLAFYGIFWAAQEGMVHTTGLGHHVFGVVGLSYLLCRFKD